MVLDIRNPLPGFRDHRQVVWDERCAADVKQNAHMWFREDFGLESDWTSTALVPLAAKRSLPIVVRVDGVIAGLSAAEVVVDEFQENLVWSPVACDGDCVQSGTVVGYLSGSVRSILQIERVILNLLGRLSGVATTTRHLVDAVQGTSCRIYDTRKTVPGWRLLDKYAVCCGGGYNHRMGLYDAILIKDNHLAALREDGLSPRDAVYKSREFISKTFPVDRANAMIVEIEVESLDQLANVLPALPDIVLLDNMSIDELRRSVALRQEKFPEVILEASGGVTLKNISAVAESGVDRISTGVPTHTSSWLDIGLDWESVFCSEKD